MNTTLQHFGLAEKEVIRKDNEFYLPISKLAKVLQVSTNTLQKNIQRNKDEFGELMDFKSINPQGGRPSYILNEEQIYTLCMISRSEKAKEFRRAFAKMIKSIRQKEYIHISEITDYINRGKLLAGIPKMKLAYYKKYRALGLSRKHCCKAFDLSYRKMREVDKILGFHKHREVPWLEKYQNGNVGYHSIGMQNKRQIATTSKGQKFRNDSDLFDSASTAEV